MKTCRSMSCYPGHRKHAYHGGFTLLEVLGVIVILGMIGAAAIRGVVSAASSEDVRLRSAAARCRELDQRARLLGRTGTPSVMMIGEDRQSLFLRILDDRSPAIFRVGNLSGIAVYLETADRREKVLFDASGRSDDYTIILRLEEQVVSLSVNGRTGLIQVKKDSLS